ncbi:MAG: M14 family metallopeptidase [Acidobacteria bacterium]|nr:M14 family metallopeptidase [Acidobacteriota bacterium]
MRMVLIAALMLGLVTRAGAQTPASIESIQTKPEQTNFEQTSTYDDVTAFLNSLAQAAPKRIHVRAFGITNEKRALPLVVVGAASAAPEAVRRTGKIRVYIQANIHAGEVEGKESAQMLLRQLAAGKHDDWLEKMVLLVAPIYNADGNERLSLTSRGRQHGPIGGQGQRPNAQGLDLNRDHMKLDSPEARAVVKMMNEYDPHVSLDLHTTNGTRHAYHLTYSPPLNPATDPSIIDLLRKEWFPAITRNIREKHGWDYYYYGNLEGGRGNEERSWRSFDHRPRFNNNYIGLRNRFALLSEAYAYATFKDRIIATSRFVEETLNFIASHATRIRAIVERADRNSLIGSTLALRARLAKSEDSVEILLGGVTQEKHPKDGHIMELRTNVKIAEKMPEYGIFEATETARVPMFYFVPPGLPEAAERLKAHGVRATPLTQATTMNIEEFQIESNTQAAAAFQNHRERTVTGKWVPARRQLAAGSLMIPMNQPLARLAFYLLEPRSDDGLANRNFLDSALGPEAKIYPIVRSVR